MKAAHLFLPLTIVLGSAPIARAQSGGTTVVGITAGGTYYCLVSRCNTGVTIGGVAAVTLAPSLLLGAGIRWHRCFDCNRFIMVESGIRLRYPGRSVQPFATLGVGWISDPDFIGSHLSPHAGAGVFLWTSTRFGIALELLGRQVRRGDRLGEASLAVVHRF